MLIYNKQTYSFTFEVIGGNESDDAATKALTIVFVVLAILILIVVLAYCLWWVSFLSIFKHCD